MAGENKLEPQIGNVNEGIVQTQGQPQNQGIVPGESVKVGVETVESIKEGRAHFQRGYQEQLAVNQELESEITSVKDQLARLNDQFQENLPPRQTYYGNQETVAPSSPAKPANTPVSEPSLSDGDYMTLGTFRQEMDRLRREEQREEQEVRQAEVNRRFEVEASKAADIVRQMEQKFPKEAMEVAFAKANHWIPNIYYIGGPTKYAECLAEYATMEVRRMGSKNIMQINGKDVPNAQTDPNIQNALGVGQPMGAGGAPPMLNDYQQDQVRRADNIAPDDPPVQ